MKKRISQCVVSSRYRFIYLAIAKNATSTLLTEFNTPRYMGYRIRYNEIEPDWQKRLYAFSAVRNPVDRLLSGYQEISMRDEMDKNPSTRKFFQMEEGEDRFCSFLDELEVFKWDSHIIDQVAYLRNTKTDFLAVLEFLERDLTYLYNQLGMGSLPDLPFSRSRQDRKKLYGYSRHLMFTKDLTKDLIKRIEKIYEEDMEMYNKVLTENESRIPAIHR